MPEMPIDPEFGRFIEGIQMTPDGGAEVEMMDEEPEIEELEDGSAVVHMKDMKGPMEDEDFYENLAESLDSSDIQSIGMRYLDMIDRDRQAREERDKKYEEGLKRTGLGNDAPGGANF